ncbi:MAG: DUF4157 domain-containing protein [Myxococcota bacterium]
MDTNRMSESSKQEAEQSDRGATRGTIQQSGDWDAQAGAMATHPGLFGNAPLYPGLIQQRLPDPIQQDLAHPIQFDGDGDERTQRIQEAAAHGLSGSAGQLPHLDQIQQAFGSHDISGIKAHTDGPAAEANQAMGADAYATGDRVVMSDTSLHTAAHEAAHIVQQRAGLSLPGGVGTAGDEHEQHADAVADAVVQGKSAESLLDKYGKGSSSGEAIQGSGPLNGIQLQDGSDQDHDDDDEDDEDQDDEPASATAVQTKSNGALPGPIQLKPADSGKKISPVKPQQAISIANSGPATTPSEGPEGNSELALPESTATLDEKADDKLKKLEDEEQAEEQAKEEAASAAATAESSDTQTGSGVQTKPNNGSTPSKQAGPKKEAAKEKKKRLGFTPPKATFNGLKFEGIEGDVNYEIFKREMPKKKLFNIGHYWPFPAFPFAGVDVKAGGDVTGDASVMAKGTYKWDYEKNRYEFEGALEAGFTLTLTIWMRGGLAINLVIQSGGVGLEASSSIEAKAGAAAKGKIFVDGNTGKPGFEMPQFEAGIGATWKAALGVAAWTEGWFYDDVWKYTFAEWTIGELVGYKLKGGFNEQGAFNYNVDPNSGKFFWGKAPDNPDK